MLMHNFFSITHVKQTVQLLCKCLLVNNTPSLLIVRLSQPIRGVLLSRRLVKLQNAHRMTFVQAIQLPSNQANGQQLSTARSGIQVIANINNIHLNCIVVSLWQIFCFLLINCNSKAWFMFRLHCALPKLSIIKFSLSKILVLILLIIIIDFICLILNILTNCLNIISNLIFNNYA